MPEHYGFYAENHRLAVGDGYPGDALIDAANEAIDLRAEVDRLRALLREANDAFDEVTDDYAKELVAGEGWRTFVADEAGLSDSKEADHG